LVNSDNISSMGKFSRLLYFVKPTL